MVARLSRLCEEWGRDFALALPNGLTRAHGPCEAAPTVSCAVGNDGAHMEQHGEDELDTLFERASAGEVRLDGCQLCGAVLVVT